jgi:D-alanyl-D-alanine carboxypeptidase
MKRVIFSIFYIFLLFVFTNQSFASIKEELEDINAISAVAIDGETGKILFAKNPHLKIPPASTVKLVTAMIVLDKLPLDKKVKISRRAGETPSIPPILYPGEIYTVKDLLYLMLMKSSNQAAVALAEAVAGSERSFVKLMNEKVQSFGLKESHFATASGLPAPDQYTTSYELALILYEALKYSFIRKIISTPVKIIRSKTGRTLVIRNTNKLLEDPSVKNKVIGGKTGFTRLSKHCLVNVANEKGRLIITAVLGAPDRETLWEDTKNLLKFSELVFEKKLSPVFINTAVNTSILASEKFISPYYYYKKHRRRYYYRRHYRRHHRRYHRRHHKRYYSYKRYTHRHYYKKHHRRHYYRKHYKKQHITNK